MNLESRSENSGMDGGEGSWLRARGEARAPVHHSLWRRWIPKAGFKEQANEAHRQKHRRRPVLCPPSQTPALAIFGPNKAVRVE